MEANPAGTMLSTGLLKPRRGRAQRPPSSFGAAAVQEGATALLRAQVSALGPPNKLVLRRRQAAQFVDAAAAVDNEDEHLEDERRGRAQASARA